MTAQFGLSKETIQKIRSVFERHASIEKALLYGSRAKGNFRPGSDIELTLIGSQIDTTELLQIGNEIEELLLPYKFDLSVFHQIENNDLIKHIERGQSSGSKFA